MIFINAAVHNASLLSLPRCFPTRYAVVSSMRIGNIGHPNSASSRSHDRMPCFASGLGHANSEDSANLPTAGRISMIKEVHGNLTRTKECTLWSHSDVKSQRHSSMAAKHALIRRPVGLVSEKLTCRSYTKGLPEACARCGPGWRVPSGSKPAAAGSAGTEAVDQSAGKSCCNTFHPDLGVSMSIGASSSMPPALTETHPDAGP
mmetsp:Transcript_6752/g.20123  ORF Transcript_6752/g.20123 Transcript_6752/m.20123 type:complete len:204 (-) Transcript_6752:122-733(-)